MEKRRTVVAPTLEEANDQAIQLRTWMIFNNIIMPDTTRREWLDLLSLALIRRDIEIVHSNGQPFQYGDLDLIFGDPDMRWLSVFLESDDYTRFPKRFSKSVDRIVMMILYIKIAKPHLAHHVERKR